ncbi:hypothetical protein E2C01_041287 [Portunus trituberculatus]|uniref:Uncharacterized protein n=1 Tax=Portunus trituberculatus TaxID=210409 RepID=A0A5B7FRI4_PORTR|nr:hypothetical protein [Portunus trituberculatus]
MASESDAKRIFQEKVPDHRVFKKTRVEDVVPEEDVDDPMEAEDDDILDWEVDSNGMRLVCDMARPKAYI